LTGYYQDATIHTSTTQTVKQMTQINQVMQRCKDIFAKAQELYGVDLSRVSVRFDLRGRAAGQACRRGHEYYIRFNRDMLTREAFDHVYNDTVPHEIAHIVCFMNPKLGRMHDAGWARVCKQLGGTGERCHSEEVVYGKGKTYEYITDKGNKVRMGDRHHAIVQSGRTLTYKKGLGKVTSQCAYSIVGVQGRTLSVPVAPKTVPVAPTKEVPVQQLMPVSTKPVAAHFDKGTSKASIARAIMLAGHNRGESYENIIAAIMLATGHERQLARAYYKNNAPKLGLPVQ
jgi:predicted SprT family Zn-dependent metalloprotease